MFRNTVSIMLNGFKKLLQVLGADGVLMLRFVHTHAGAIVARDITVRLYRVYNCIYPVIISFLKVEQDCWATEKDKEGDSEITIWC